jgi:Flp pilus assembly pilin Flp
MKYFKSVVIAVAADDRGGEVLEYVLIAGIIVIAAIAVIAAIGGKNLVRWTSLKCSL